jgi:hypothetical protein
MQLSGGLGQAAAIGHGEQIAQMLAVDHGEKISNKNQIIRDIIQ